MKGYDGKKIAVLIPCFNEEATVAKVVRDFSMSLPGAAIYVYDNNSTDRTGELAAMAGAIVRREYRQGKGNVVRAMFRNVDADIYIMVDGDGTYPAERAPDLLTPVANEEADMVVGTRLNTYTTRSFRKFHVIGNNLVVGIINMLFGSRITDCLSGYRAFSKHFVKGVALMSTGFEVETELTIQAMDRRFITQEVPIPYGERPKGSVSKLDTFGDGILIMRTILRIFKDYRPLIFFSVLGALLLFGGLLIGIPVVVEFWRTGLVFKVPSAILASGLVILSMLMVSVGLILDTIAVQHRESYQYYRNMMRMLDKRDEE